MADKSSQRANLTSTIRTGIDNRLKDLHTAMPGIIQSFDSDRQLATVQPAIRRVFKSVNDESIETLTPTNLSILINVPVVYPGGGGFHLTFPVVRGDECLLVFCERSYDRWYNFGGVQNPGARRFHDLSDATAFVGITSRQNSISSYDSSSVQLRNSDGTTAITISGDSVSVVASSEIELTATDITIVGNVDITGTVTNNTQNIGNTHGHAQGNDGAGDAEAPIVGVT